MPRSYLPTADAQLLAWAQNFFARVDGSAGDYGLSDPQISAFEALLLSFAAKYTVAYEPTSRTRPAIAAKDAAKKLLAANSRLCVKIVQATPGISDAQRRDLKITVAKARRPVPQPTVRPMVELGGVVGRVVSVNVYDSTSATKRGKPANCVGAKLYTFVGTSYPSDPTLWAYQGDYTKTKCDVIFPDSVAGGQQVWVCAAWYTRTSTGPASLPVSTNLQGGGVNAAGPAMKIAA